jgi:predicted ArsR family transcriptional regulator
MTGGDPGIRTTVAAAAEVLGLDKNTAWQALKVLEALGLARRDGKEKPPGHKGAGVDVYVLEAGWRAALAEKLGALR